MAKKNRKKELKLNLGCGRNVKAGWVNVDFEEKDNKLDVIVNLAKKFPFKTSSCDYIYNEHFIEHLTWLDGLNFLKNCFRCLKPGGTLRLVFPDFKRIFKAYLDGDAEFFKAAGERLNGADYDYYRSVYDDPEKIRLKRKNNLPPAWHLSRRPADRKRLAERVRKFKYPIDYVDWSVHQFGEHQCLYDGESMSGILKEIGFKKVKISQFKPGLDSTNQGGRKASVYIEAVK